MIEPKAIRLHDGHHWLRVADEGWEDPLDPSYAQRHGGRWNPPGSFPVLYLNEDLETARSRIYRMLEGQPVNPEDLDAPFVLVVARLSTRQRVADAVSVGGLAALDLPDSYPVDKHANRIPHPVCQPIGTAVKQVGLRGLQARSAATLDGAGRELAWFPARPSSRASQVGDPIPFARWWNAVE